MKEHQELTGMIRKYLGRKGYPNEELRTTSTNATSFKTRHKGQRLEVIILETREDGEPYG